MTSDNPRNGNVLTTAEYKTNVERPTLIIFARSLFFINKIGLLFNLFLIICRILVQPILETKE